MTDATNPAAERPSPLALAACVLAAAFALLPAIPSFELAKATARIPVLPLAPAVRLDAPAAGAPPLADAQSASARADGMLAVADWTRQHVLVFRNLRAVPEWLPPRGRFEVQFGADGSLVLLDVSTGQLHLFDASGRFRRTRSVSLAGAAALGALPGGGFVVANGRDLVRLSAGLDDSPFPGAVPLADVRGLAASRERIWAATGDGTLVTLSGDGRVLFRTRLVGNPGRLAASPDEGVVLADARTGRVWAFDRNGRLLGRLGPPFAQRIAGTCFAPGGELVVAGEEAVWRAPREGA